METLQFYNYGIRFPLKDNVIQAAVDRLFNSHVRVGLLDSSMTKYLSSDELELPPV